MDEQLVLFVKERKKECGGLITLSRGQTKYKFLPSTSSYLADVSLDMEILYVQRPIDERLSKPMRVLGVCGRSN